MIFYSAKNTKYILKPKRIYTKWIKSILFFYGKKVGDINFVFCNDEYLLDVSIEFLEHDYYTDVITFDTSSYCTSKSTSVISADIFISIDSVLSNSKQYKVSFEEELRRVMAHGLLHLLGFDDHTEEDKLLMIEKETFFIERFTEDVK